MLPFILTFASRYDNVDFIEQLYKLEMSWLTRKPFLSSAAGTKRMEKRARKLLLRGGKFYRLTLLMSLLFCIPFVLLWRAHNSMMFLVPLGLLFFVISIVVHFGQNVGDFQLELKKRALRNLLRSTKLLEHQDVFLELAERSDPDSKRIALRGLSQIATAASLEAIEAMRAHTIKEVARIAKISYDRLKKVLDGEKPMALTSMKTMQSRLSGLTILLNAPDQMYLQEARERIDSMVYSQLLQRQSYPNVFCRQCWARAEEHHFRDWHWVNCKICKEAKELVCDVQIVVGQIGGDEPWELTDGKLRIGLWKNATKELRYAELDQLEIIGGQPIECDWAVGAWVEANHKRQNKASRKVTIKLLNHPSLSPNSLRLLQAIDPTLQTAV
jgi:hypothetical protein